MSRYINPVSFPYSGCKTHNITAGELFFLIGDSAMTEWNKTFFSGFLFNLYFLILFAIKL